MTSPETIMSAPRNPSTRIDFTKEFEIDGCPYSVRVTTAPDMTDALNVELVGMGPGGEATDGRFTVHTSALPHLGRVLTRTFNALAALHSAVPSPRRDRGRGQRRGGKPGNSHQPWTHELETRLAEAWQAADPSRSPAQIAAELARICGVPIDNVQGQFEQPAAVHAPDEVIAAIAAFMERTPVAITSRLEKLGLNPDHPGTHAKSTALSTAPRPGGDTRVTPECT
ncbi:hypothetical protein [Alloactinosynnema sp. L-07]|uniref:hypothetical protein n=1 Tax=Alloactinosynnema sp. L-07 TaxID=1653480 RepID=UPI00065F005A|nr:hypothetical protein [Alloactinosynnema sp. L-07]CRK56916.1 hypothetical protein [Alloactinosynnema sp. L-07]